LTRLLLVAALALAVAAPAGARTARDLSSRMRIDGFTSDFADSERVFGVNPSLEEPEESTTDSQWGENNDVNQIRITWDDRNLYLAGEGRIWDNNMILFIDSWPGIGLGSMDSLNSWRRNFSFDTTGIAGTQGFAPDLFCATWDGNTSPHLIVRRLDAEPQRVLDLEASGGYFVTAATFDKSNTGRSMEVALPWSTVFLSPVGRGTRDTVIFTPMGPDTIHRFTPGTRLRLAAVVTAGADGTGGPDSAPDNTRGHSNNSGDAVIVDNWAIIDIDRIDDTGIGAGGPDGVADRDVEPLSRVSFRIQPPILPTVARSLRFSLRDVDLSRPVIRPDLGETFTFRVQLDPPPDPANEFHAITGVRVLADIYDLRGRFVRRLLPAASFRVLELGSRSLAGWDGRDESGRIVEPGIYVLRVEQENLDRVNRAVVVAR
jgi:hypothetical protein